MNEVRFSSFAETDIENISDYFVQYSVDSTRKFLNDLMRKFQLIADNPKIGRTHEDFFEGLKP